ncbi:MAG TPA: carboxypeptidase-like regulatory domain-containing protein, partial [Thermoanaerobaculia bacterium]|nr:carboxypeptidase-like regulatory domain-containing protein [Thermoanaerobaculia bacterium]
MIRHRSFTMMEMMKNGFGVLACCLLFLGSAALAGEEPSEKGSLLVRVVAGEDGRAIANAVVEAIDRETVQPGAPRRQVSETVLASARSDDKGWARLERLPPGEIFVRVLPKGRTYPHVSEALTVFAGEEAVVDELEVPPPGSVAIHLELSDSIRTRMEEGVVKGITLHGTSDRRDGVSLEATTREPEIVLDEVPPGRWRFRAVLDLGEGKSGTVVDPRGLEIEVPEGTRIDASMKIPTIVFAGRVTQRGEPVEADLVQMALSPAGRKPGRFGFTVVIDEQGMFVLPLLHPGKYDLRIFADERVASQIPSFEFREIDADDLIEIELPEGRIEGVVVDAAGNPARDVDVDATLGEGRGRPIFSNARSDEAGEFILDGLIEGEWRMAAATRDVRSEDAFVSLAEDDTRTGVVLRLSLTNVKVRVLDVSGVARPGLVVEATSRGASGEAARGRGTTDEQGIAGIGIPGTAGAPISLAVGPVTGEWAAPFLLPFAREIIVTLPGAFGSVVLPGRDGPNGYLVWQSGAFLET